MSIWISARACLGARTARAVSRTIARWWPTPWSPSIFRICARSSYPSLAAKYFASNGKLDYNLSIVSRKEPDWLFYHSNTTTYELAPSSGDATVNLFSVRLDEFNRLLLDDSFDLSDLPAVSDSRAWRIAVSRSPIAEPASGTALAGSAGGRWKLILNHQAGSLDQAVSDLLLKNLLVSFGICCCWRSAC